jgi:electron transfer flavoprotein alpha subunit
MGEDNSMKTVVIAEHESGHLKSSTANTVTAATELSEQVIVLVAGLDCRTVAEAAATLHGVSEVWWVEDAVYQQAFAETLTPLILSLLAENPEITAVLAPATSFGKNLLPRVAAKLDLPQVSDVVRIISGDTFVRPIYAGNALATVQVNASIKCLTIRTTAFMPATLQANAAPISTKPPLATQAAVRFIKREGTVSARPELSAAKIVVSGGRGLQNKENFVLIEQLADALGAAVGASRAAVDAGFVPNDFQVGQTGKVVAPELYIAVGISGAIQHIAGMKDSKVIVAINKDPEAPIFSVANYGLVGDLFEIVPEFCQLLKN